MRRLTFALLIYSSFAFSRPISSKEGKERREDANISYQEEEALLAPKDYNCKIQITSIRHSGVVDVQNLYQTASSESECKKSEQVHRHNLFPDQVKDKKVSSTFKK